MLGKARRLAVLSALVPLVFMLALASPATQGSGTVQECYEESLRAALQGGGLVTIACTDPITVRANISIESDTEIEGGGATITAPRVTTHSASSASPLTCAT